MRAHRSARAVILGGTLAVATLAVQVVAPLATADAQGPARGTAQGSARGTAVATTSSGHNGGTLVFGTYSGLTNLDPVHINGGGTSGGSEGGAIYGYLMRYDYTSKKFVPYLAKSLTPNSTFTTWTMTLRPGMTFSDGTPFNAQAVVQNIKRDMGTPSVAQVSLALLSSVVATNDTTVTFTLTQPWSGFAYVLSWVPGLIAAPSYIAQIDAGNAQATPIGAGPFTVSSFKPGTSVTLAPNPHYALGKPHLSKLEFTFIPGGPSTLQAYQAGQLDAALLGDAPSVTQAEQQGIPAIVSNFDFGSEVILNNRSTSPLSNLKLRQAITLAFNPRVWNERINGGAQLASNLLFPKGSKWYTPNQQKIPHNLAKARKLVSEVKKQTGWDGMLRYISANTSSPNLPVVMEAMLKPIGIKVDATSNVPLTTLEIQVIVDHDFDMASWGINAADAEPFYGLWSNFVSPKNYAGYSDPAMNSAVNALGAATKPAAQQSAMKGFIASFLSSYPVVNTGVSVYRTVHKSDVHGLYQTIGAAILFDKASVS